nr:S41 family peptidase [uncultured Draconibacterium sp.]
MKFYLVTLLTLFSFFSNAQHKTEYLTKKQIKSDLKYLDKILQKQSSYQGLNGFNYQTEFNEYINQIDGTKTTKSDFGLFLSRVIGKIGDRHSYIRGYDLSETLYFPFTFAPFNDKVVVINYNKTTKGYEFRDAEFPYLKSINNITVDKILPQILPEEIFALLRAVRELRDIETVFSKIGAELPNPLPITLVNENGTEKEVKVKLVPKSEKAYLWDERFGNQSFFWKEEDFNDMENIKQFFSLNDDIAYIQIVEMLSKYDSPAFFEYLNTFMTKADQTDAIIIDVRNNGGGTRDLIQELAGYFVHPDSVYVVNATRQRGKLPLSNEIKEELHSRYLFSKNELDIREQKAVDKFMYSFKPMYDLDDEKYSDFHYYILNGEKLAKNKYHYNKPIYILANERTFSAASVLVSVFKGLPNIKIVGVNTDGSSGNSRRFELPKSGFRGKISTMVSFQKDGKILDGIGTQPDIKIDRDLDQIFFKEDFQLEKLKEIISV